MKGTKSFDRCHCRAATARDWKPSRTGFTGLYGARVWQGYCFLGQNFLMPFFLDLCTSFNVFEFNGVTTELCNGRRGCHSTAGPIRLVSLKLTWHLKNDGWKTLFLLGRPTFRGYVSFRDLLRSSCQIQQLKDKLAETQAEHLGVWHFGTCWFCIGWCKSLFTAKLFGTNCFSQGNSDSTRTFDQAQSSSSDAAAQQQLQEIESLKAEAAQVRCGLSSYH